MTSWNHFCQSVLRYPSFAFSLDYSLMNLHEEFFQTMEGKIAKALADMKALEAGAIANPDEQRMVGHYWLRNAALAPSADIRAEITAPLTALTSFAQKIHTAQITPPTADRYEQVLLIGIGGSALGPQLVADALSHQVKLPLFFLDNTDPAGIDRTMAALQPIGLAKTLVLVISKSGGTPETRNGMLEAKAVFEKHGLAFGKQAVAITGAGSQLDQFATKHQFLTTFPMQDWIGGRTSVMSTVGLVPAALQGIDIQEFLRGAAAMDERTRQTNTRENAAMLLALAWYQAGNGKGERAMVVLPYKDSLCLFSKYLQQLVMESLGKEHDLDGQVVHQGLSVYGNKGSTDQHAYVQQLRDGLNNFFATFLEVRKGRHGNSIEVEPNTNSADYLQGFLRGTRKALFQAGRPSVTISIPEVTPFHLGSLIALFERAVSFYASLVNINAYHQPGVEAGKKAATTFLVLLNQVRGKLTAHAHNAEQIASECSGDASPEDVYHCLTHLHANGEAQIAIGATPAQDTFSL